MYDKIFVDLVNYQHKFVKISAMNHEQITRRFCCCIKCNSVYFLLRCHQEEDFISLICLIKMLLLILTEISFL